MLEVSSTLDEQEQQQLWAAGVAAYPPYTEYQEKTTRQIPVFIAEPR